MSAQLVERDDRDLLDLVPCPSWCDGHPDGVGVHDNEWEAVVVHVARTGARLRATNPDFWTDWRGPVYVRRADRYCAGAVEIGEPTIDLNVNGLDCLQDVVDLSADLLVAGLVLGEALR